MHGGKLQPDDVLLEALVKAFECAHLDPQGSRVLLVWPLQQARADVLRVAGLLLGVLGCAAFCMVDEPVAVLHEYGLETGVLPRHSVSKVALLTLARLPKGWFSTAGTR